ncbi:hypothetical protein M9Y10_013704 [Tritrichomonas musculus]|uniref:Viral A-type inclusion protein n=1 Tax=Tritrichomonas musculus TaxID=1915356 RepID=A0ABR2KXI4_9EUKA
MTKSSEEMQSQELKSTVFNDINILHTTTSETSNSANKDTIIDNLQEKMGELLKTNQELCSVRNQIQIIKEKNIVLQSQLEQEKKISSQIPELQKEISEKSTLIINLKNQINDLKQNNDSLNSNIESLKQKIEQITQDSQNELKQKVNMQTSELKATIEIKNNEIQSLKQQLEELKALNTSNNESIIQSRIDKERLMAVQADKEKESLLFKEEMAKLTNKFKLIKEKHQKERENSQNLMITLNKYKSEIDKYKQKDQLTKERNEKLEQSLHEAKDLVRQVLSIKNPQFQTIEELNNYVTHKKEENKFLKNELRTQKKTVKRFAFAIQKYEEKISNLNTNIAKAKTADASLKTQIETQLKDFEQLNNKLDICQRKLSIIPVYENVTADLRNRLQEILTVIRPEIPEVTVRSLCIFIIMLRRWKNLTGLLPKTYVSDSRNWWWMNPPESQKLTSSEISNLITSLRNKVEKYKNLSDQLQYQIEQYDQKLKDSQNCANKSSKTMRYNAKKIADLENQIEELEKLTHYDIKTNSEYQGLIERLKETEAELEETQQKLRESEIEVSNLQITLSRAKQQLSNQCLLTRQKERALEDTKYQLYSAQKGIAHLKQGNNMRTKEILSLERGIQKEKRNATSANTQNAVLTLENRRMNFMISNQNRENLSNSPEHQFVDQSPK